MSALRSGFEIAGLVGLLALPCAAPGAADDGDLDPTFDGGAFTVGWLAGHARATVAEPIAAGELLVGGTVGEEPGEIDGWVVAKLEADGSRDPFWALAFQIVSAGDETMAVSDQVSAPTTSFASSCFFFSRSQSAIISARVALPSRIRSSARAMRSSAVT